MVVWLQSADSTVAKRIVGPEVAAVVPTVFLAVAVGAIVWSVQVTRLNPSTSGEPRVNGRLPTRFSLTTSFTIRTRMQNARTIVVYCQGIHV